MPSGKVHTLATGLSSVASIFLPSPDVETNVLISFGCLVGLVVYPDLDVNTGNYGNFLVRVVFGDKLEKVWKVFWYPYSKLMYHRSFLSHFPVVSTIVRVSYVGLPAILLMLALGLQWNERLVYVLYGLIFVDLLHSVMDILSTTIKRIF